MNVENRHVYAVYIIPSFNKRVLKPFFFRFLQPDRSLYTTDRSLNTTDRFKKRTGYCSLRNNRRGGVVHRFFTKGYPTPPSPEVILVVKLLPTQGGFAEGQDKVHERL